MVRLRPAQPPGAASSESSYAVAWPQLGVATSKGDGGSIEQDVCHKLVEKRQEKETVGVVSLRRKRTRTTGTGTEARYKQRNRWRQQGYRDNGRWKLKQDRQKKRDQRD